MDQDNAPEQENLFEDYIQHTPAATGQRLVNWLIDNLLMRFGLSYITGTAVGYIIGKFFPEYARHIVYDQNTKDALLRSLSRLVPFEVLSGFGYKPWHDAWTKTTVIKTR